MTGTIGRRNITFGWTWMFLGILVAAGIGLYAFTPDWLGGYASLQRRFLRLGHISFIALPLINIIYGLLIDTARLSDRLKKTGSALMIIAATFMPLINFLCIVNVFFQNFFFIPALSFAGAVALMMVGQVKRPL